MEVTPINDAFGASIANIDLSSITDGEFEEIYAHWLNYRVLVVRGQNLTDDALEAFSARFGPLDTIPYFSKLGLSEEEFREKGLGSIYILPISNVEKDGKKLGVLGDGEVHWHADTNYMKTPCVGMVLFGKTIPGTGGDTQFADQAGAYESLPDALKTQIATLSIKHDASHTSDGNVRPGFEEFASKDLSELPGELHPIVFTHPETGRKSLFLGRRAFAYVDGLSREESEALLDELWAYAVDPRHVISHQWQAGDVIIWDNRCLLHHREPYTGERFLKRCQINAA